MVNVVIINGVRYTPAILARKVKDIPTLYDTYVNFSGTYCCKIKIPEAHQCMIIIEGDENCIQIRGDRNLIQKSKRGK